MKMTSAPDVAQLIRENALLRQLLRDAETDRDALRARLELYRYERNRTQFMPARK